MARNLRVGAAAALALGLAAALVRSGHVQAFTLRELVELAITESDNIAANMLLRRFGREAVARYEQVLGARWVYDPEAGFFVTTPRDMARILYELVTGQVLPPAPHPVPAGPAQPHGLCRPAGGGGAGWCHRGPQDRHPARDGP